MPFVSDAQRRWGHTPAGMKALGGPAKVAEWDAATKGKNLPERASRVGTVPLGGKHVVGGNVPMPKTKAPKLMRGPRAKKAPKVVVKPIRGTPLAGVLGFNAGNKLLGK